MPETASAPRISASASVFTLLSLAVALWPYTSVIDGGGWLIPLAFVALIVTLIGALLRRVLAGRAPWLRWGATALAQIALLLGTLTVMFGRETALLGIFPTFRTAELVPVLITQASSAIWHGIAPIAASPPLVFVATSAFGLLVIVLDHLLTHGRVILTALVVAGVGVVPMIITFSTVDPWWFVVYAVLVLALLRRSVRRERKAPRRASFALTATVGVCAITATLLLGPSLPQSATGIGPGTQVALNPSLDLGRDLRQPTSLDIITLATDAPRAPYLRLATLSRFDGAVWTRDTAATQPVSQGFGPTELSDDLDTRSTSIRVQDVAGQILPLPYPATGAVGLGPTWEAMPANRTLVTGTASVRDQDYTVTSLVVNPSREEMRTDRVRSDVPRALLSLPDDVPVTVGELAREVTADAGNDYDRLIALQSWFRGQFSYSLSAPVEQGFDGSGAEAVGRFLEVRSGYCVHFAAAFTLMARSLDMPARIVVGYLPGSPTGDRRGDESLFVVSSDQLHAWPEVYFEEWGWIPFEPTASLGTPTSFATSAEQEEAERASPTPTPSAPSESAAPTDREIERDDVPGATAEQGAGSSFNILPTLGMIAGVALVLLLPAILRLARRATRMLRAVRGDAASAWRELEDTLVDLGIPVSDTETPRARGVRLQKQHGVKAPDALALVEAIERASYAGTDAGGGDLSAPLRHVIRQLVHVSWPKARFIALFVPRSLLPRTTEQLGSLLRRGRLPETRILSRESS